MYFSQIETENVELLESLINYRFKNRQLALNAISLPVSRADITSRHFEGMEFAGDRIYNMCAALHVFATSAIRSPHALDASLQKRISNARQVEIAKSIGLENVLLMQRRSLPSHAAASHVKMLADVLEAVMTAVFIDTNCNFNAVYALYLESMENVPTQLPMLQTPSSTQMEFAF